MRRILIDAHGELRDHLAPRRRDRPFPVDLELPAGLRDLVQSTGIPHVEVKDAEVNGAAADWDRRIDDGDVVRLAPRYPLGSPPDGARFLLDVHLGKLARLLRLLGMDAAHHADAADADLAAEAAATGRVLLTRDRGLLMRAAVRRGRWVRATVPEAQAAEVLRAFALAGEVDPFTRCLECNTLLEPTEPEPSEVPPRVAERHERFTRCPGCSRVYWAGSHHARLQATVDRILAAAGPRR
jgi:uncharacterized protein